MPRIPQVSAPEDVSSPASRVRVAPERIAPVLAPAVRANPHMRDAEFAAGHRVGQAAQDAGALLFRVKNATDAAYITRAQTQMEAANLDFQNWTKSNPDPTTWQQELDGRMSAVRESVTEGGKSLSPLARKRLGLVVGDWEMNTRKRVQLQATEANLQIAQASYTEFINQAAANNDLAGIEVKVNEAVRTGIFDPKSAQTLVSRARIQIAQNMANGLIETDPFEAERQLQEKDAAGDHVRFPGMSDTARQTLVFRAHKAAAQTRANTMREWATMVSEWQAGRGLMPDREAMEQEAAHQGISPKWLANLFKVPAATDPGDFARVYSAIITYEPTQDPTGRRMGELVADIEGFKGPARDRLDNLLTARMKPDDTLNSPVAKFGVASIKDMFEIGGYGQYREPAGYDSQGNRVPGRELPGPKQKAETVMARNMDLFHDWLKKNPEATYEQAQKYINSLNTEQATNSAGRLIIEAGAFGLPIR